MWERRRHIVSRSFKRDTLYCVAHCMWESRHLLDTQGIPVFQKSTSSSVISWILVFYVSYFILYIVGGQTLARHSRDPGYLLDGSACTVNTWNIGCTGWHQKKCWSKRYLLLIAPIGYVEKHKWKG